MNTVGIHIKGRLKIFQTAFDMGRAVCKKQAWFGYLFISKAGHRITPHRFYFVYYGIFTAVYYAILCRNCWIMPIVVFCNFYVILLFLKINMLHLNIKILFGFD
ncbi:hypothetical protein, partial [Neisseria dentiae]|uniref:hypothetical protein n=1 Tax=Neisseria dentiae TaxID=194197 RepID=UPI0035A1C01F